VNERGCLIAYQSQRRRDNTSGGDAVGCHGRRRSGLFGNTEHLRIQKRNNNGASIRDPSVPIESERDHAGACRGGPPADWGRPPREEKRREEETRAHLTACLEKWRVAVAPGGAGESGEW